MNERPSDPYADLERLFHEPRRLAILSHLIGAEGGLSFREIKESCDLTDGNLNRHLKVLEDAAVIRIEKGFVASRPRTTVFLTEDGRRGFRKYLAALEAVLAMASSASASASDTPTPSAKRKRSRKASPRSETAPF